MVMCWAPDCKHYNQRETCKFFRFPKEENERKRWIKLLRRDNPPGPGAFVCSCHFKDGDQKNGPELFVHNVGKRFTFSTPEKRRRRRTRATSDSGEFVIEGETEPVHYTTNPDDAEPQPSTSGMQSSSSSSKIQFSKSSVELDVENYMLKKQLEIAEGKSISFSFDFISNKNELVTLYTGLPNTELFEALYTLLENLNINYYLKWNVEKLHKKNQLLLCLMKLRQNFPHEDLALRFNVSQAVVTNVILTWVHVLHEILYKQLMANIPSRKHNKSCLPNCFSTFTNCRIVLDCTEMATVVARSSMSTQKATYSAYKHRNTWKALVGVAPNGVVTYVSDLYPGSTSDKKIVQHCGILNHLEGGDLILADKGFLIKDIVPAGVHVNIPPFLVTPQFTQEQVYQTEKIARARIHVERAIRRMKSYKILSFIPHNLLRHADAIVQVIGGLTNLHNPLIKEVEHCYLDESEQSESNV